MASAIKTLGLATLLALTPLSFSNAKDYDQDSNAKGKWSFEVGPSVGYELASPFKDFLNTEYDKTARGDRTSGASVSGASSLSVGNPLYMGVQAGVERRLNDTYSVGGFVGYNQTSQKASSSGGVTALNFPVDATYDLSQKNILFGVKGQAHLLNERANPYVGLGLDVASVSGDYTIHWTGAAVRTIAGNISASEGLPSLELGADGKIYGGLFWDASASVPLRNSVNASWTETSEQTTLTKVTDRTESFKKPVSLNLLLKWVFGK